MTATASEKHPVVQIWSDSDWACDVNGRRSVSGSLVYLDGALVSWQSKRQKTVALSSTEAEYMAMTDGVREGLYVFNFLSEMFQVSEPMELKYDNQGAGYLSLNEINNTRSKHIDVRYHFIRTMVVKGRILPVYVHTSANLADALTKPLDKILFNMHLPGLLNPCDAHLRG
jgi:hypothetical protein